jgi:hypothetical protein
MTTMVTERAARLGSRATDRPATTLPAATTHRILPGRTVAYAWLLAGAPIAALQLDHAGVHEQAELPPLLHWFRDTALAAPAAAVAVVVAALVVGRIRASEPGERPSLVGAAAWGFLAAALFAAASVPLGQLHGSLFEAEEEIGVSPLAHALGEGFTTLQVALLVLVPLALIAGVPWRGGWRGRQAHQTSTETPAPKTELLHVGGDR